MGNLGLQGIALLFLKKSLNFYWTRRYHDVNVIGEKYQYSDLLQRKLSVRLSTKAFKMIRKYGGFDNYILLAKPKNMDSRFGEYLRKLMLLKLNDKNFRVPYIVQQKVDKLTKFQRRDLFYKKKWETKRSIYPVSIRHHDLSQHIVKPPSQFSKQQFEKYKDFFNPNLVDDIPANHPVIQEFMEENKRQREILEPERQKIAQYLAKFKQKNVLKKYLEVVEEGKRDFKNNQITKE